MKITILPEDEEMDYDGHTHVWKYVETYGDGWHDDGGYYECGVKRYTCTVCGIDTEVMIE
tara:strand:- start:1983 stop:2162 length:180 start_codon:yes stop_codon:yes gene_type:complete